MNPASPRTSARNLPGLTRRRLLGASLSTSAALACATTPGLRAVPRARSSGRPVLVGSKNGLPGMQRFYGELVAGAEPLDVALEVVKIVEADPDDTSVGLGGLPNEDGVVQLDSAVMHGPTHNSGGVACIENILHPCEVARLVMERTDHCLIVGRGAYEFARQHGFPHTELLTEGSRRAWLEWKESMSDRDDRFPPLRKGEEGDEQGRAESRPGPRVARKEAELARPTGTIHCSALSAAGEVACTTTTSGLAYKIPGRVGDSPIVGAGLYCDQEAGSAGATGRGEAAILSNGSFAIVELMRQGMSPRDAGVEVLERIARQARRAAAWQPGLLREDGTPAFNVHFYIVDLEGRWAGVGLHGGGEFAVADPEGGPRIEPVTALFEA